LTSTTYTFAETLAKQRMADQPIDSKRSKIMASIKSTGNRSTELKLVGIMRAYGITGWRRCQALPGKPDFVFRKERLVVFVDGCFWHGCRWHCRMPKSRLDYWEPKIERNRQRDKRVRALLETKGWRVHRIWEHQLKRPNLVAQALVKALTN
jgi:DNA mismatch endonuclease, patch repair protein